MVLVEPQYDGNLGFVSRVIKNFGITDLHIVNPAADINSDECRDRSVHAQEVLDNARIYDTFAEAAPQFTHTAAFAARAWSTDKSHRRTPISIEEYGELVGDLEGDIALVFGREDDGLANEDVERCDTVVTIPTHEMYRSMNLSHAVAVGCYEVSKGARQPPRKRLARDSEKQLLIEYIEKVLAMLKYPAHRVKITSMAMQRIVGRAAMTRWEYHRLMGIFHRMLKFGDIYPELRDRYRYDREAGDDNEDRLDDDAPTDKSAIPDGKDP